MKIYIDDNFKCYSVNDGTLREVEDDFFNGKCADFIEGVRFVPEGEKWTREDGEVFEGKMISFCKDSTELDAAQREYERELLADAENALAILFGGETA